MNFILTSVLALALAGQAGAAAPSDTPADYPHSLPLSVSGTGGVVAFRLPQSVYLRAATPDLRDLRLFDKDGNKLAFALQRPPAQARTSRSELPARIFPVTGARGDAQGDDAGGLDIRTGSDGRLLSVTRAARAGEVPGKAELSSLVLDIGQTDAAVNALRFRLPAGTASYHAQVWLEVSDDLKRWEPIGAAALDWLVNSDTQTLANDRIEFEARRLRYARLSWREGAPLLFAGISAESISQTDIAPHAERLVLQAAPGKVGQDLVYKGAVAIPVEKIGLQFSEPNVVLPSVLGRYHELPGRQLGQPSTLSFEPLVRATFYQITQAGRTRSSGDMAVAPLHNAQWVLRPLNGAGGKPALRLVWSPSSVVFLANGKPPYTLAFGRADAAAAAVELEQVAPGFSQGELQTLEQAQAGPLASRQPDSAAPAVAAGAARAAQLRLAALWAVLLLGVGVLGFFAWRLIKQMNDQDKAP
ncbi:MULTISPECIES: DUF3999 family protein [unclassified Janthinobacterium]|uniref:DUF3999 family protein n=1 Tax=unclassified Janthinobacterium TaxID=2610881 RepID=UPI00034578B2|nr:MULTISPECIES: DUF3999 family protein [unclassified Janthinobacterium]MEC5159576.1 hypothetical protein [Janthinobacterium sp. CG_S6]